jgi:hypothetical protein
LNIGIKLLKFVYSGITLKTMKVARIEYISKYLFNFPPYFNSTRIANILNTLVKGCYFRKLFFNIFVIYLKIWAACVLDSFWTPSVRNPILLITMSILYYILVIIIFYYGVLGLLKIISESLRVLRKANI